MFGSADHGPVVVGVAEVEVGGDGLAAAPAGDRLASVEFGEDVAAGGLESPAVAALLGCTARAVVGAAVFVAESAAGVVGDDRGAAGSATDLHDGLLPRV